MKAYVGTIPVKDVGINAGAKGKIVLRFDLPWLVFEDNIGVDEHDEVRIPIKYHLFNFKSHVPPLRELHMDQQASLPRSLVTQHTLNVDLSSVRDEQAESDSD